VSAIYDALPGIEVPVGEINQRLAAMWEDTAASGGAAPTVEDAKATQVNFVLHLGFKTNADDAATQFQTAVRFSQRYPSRIVVLCPIADEAHTGVEMRAKIYGECFLGKSKTDKRCVEFVLLSYPYSARRFLENEVSICLSADLPVYYWAHRFSASNRLADYQYLLRRAKRVLIDSAVAPEGALTYPWPHPDALRDLALARLLPVRQSLGQFLAAYEPGVLVGGLTEVAVSHTADLTAEAQALTRWLSERLRGCGAPASMPLVLKAITEPARGLGLEFRYDDARKRFSWTGDLVTQHALFQARLGDTTTQLPAAVSLLSPEAALSEAMFF
jgi:glucose-6-phosphate dehydrogenase assembly protein OpcA